MAFSTGQVPSISDMFGQLSPLQNQINQQAQGRAISIAQQYPQFDQALLSKALSEGGALSQGSGFNDTSNGLWTLTPEAFKAQMDRQVPLQKQIADAVQLKDLVTGNSKTREELNVLNRSAQQGAFANVGTAANLQNSALDRSQKADQFDQDMQNKRDTLAAHIKESAERNKIDWARLTQQDRQWAQEFELKQRNQKMLEETNVWTINAIKAGMSTNQAPNFKNTDLAKDYTDLYSKTIDKDGKPKPGMESMSTDAYLKQKLFTGSVGNGSPVPLPRPYTTKVDGQNLTFTSMRFSDGSDPSMPVPGYYGIIKDPQSGQIAPRILFDMGVDRKTQAKEVKAGVAVPHKKYGNPVTGMQ